MSTPVAIRAAEVSDLDALMALNAQVQSLHAGLLPDRFHAQTDALELRSFFAQRLACDSDRLFLAECGGAPVGYIWFALEARPASVFTRALRRVHIHHIAVDAAARRRGIASALLAEAEAFARKHGCAEVALDVWSANTAARAFFASRDFAPQRLFLAKPIS